MLLAGGWLVQAGLRAWFGRMQVMPLANPDETAYLIAARVLGGGPGADLSGSTLYPGGYPLHSVQGTIHVFEMAAGQLWRVVLDSWGIAGIGLVAAVAVIVRRDIRTDLRIMAGLAVAVAAGIALTAPAALPSDQSQTWASGRYLDGMIITFFLAGAVVLLRAGLRPVLACLACTTAVLVVAAVTVAVYAGPSLPTSGFGSSFNFAEPAVLTRNWNQASVLLATAVTLALLACWVAMALAARRWRAVLPVLGGCVAAVSLVVLAQMTSQVSQAATVQAQAVNVPVSASGVRPGEQVAVSSDLGWQAWVPLAYQVSWTELQFFNPASQPPRPA